MTAGDGVWFLGDTACHRGKPSLVVENTSTTRTSYQKETFLDRKLLFWYSWEKAALPSHLKPDIDFQLNPWTIYSVVNPDFSNDLVSSFLFFLHFFFLFILTIHWYREQQHSFFSGWTTILTLSLETLRERPFHFSKVIWRNFRYFLPFLFSNTFLTLLYIGIFQCRGCCEEFNFNSPLSGPP